MQNALPFFFFLLSFSLSAQSINLTIGEQTSNFTRQVIALEDGGWLVISDVADIDGNYRIKPRLQRISAQGEEVWSVSIPFSYYNYGTIGLYYDPMLQQCYFLHVQDECDLILPSKTYAYDLDGNPLWTDAETFEPELYAYRPNATTVVPGGGIFSLMFNLGLLYRSADGAETRMYALDGLNDGIYHWVGDTLLITRNERLFYATYDDVLLNVFAEQVFSEDEVDVIHVLNRDVIYSQIGNALTRQVYDEASQTFVADTTVIMSTSGAYYEVSLSEEHVYAVGDEQNILVYSFDLREREQRTFNIPGTILSGVAANGEQELAYGSTVYADYPDDRYPRESYLYDLTAAPALTRDLELTRLTSAGIYQVDGPNGNTTVSTFDSIVVTVRNVGLDTVSDFRIKIQKRAQSDICPGHISINAPVSDIQLLPGDSIDIFLGSLEGTNVIGTELCAWVGTEAAAVESDYTNNGSCVELDIINDTRAPVPALLTDAFPNPTTGRVQIFNTEQWQSYQLYDARGVLLRGGSLTGEQSASFDLSGLPAGLYHILLREGERAGMARVVKR